DVLSLYIDYEGDYTDPYNTFACCEVKSFDNVPDGMSAKIVPASKYAVISVDGTSPEKVLEAWENIWDSNLKRAYEGDFDVYSEDFLNEKTSTLKIYVSIK
ncbi:MAG: effector binding domain-containing protein, partial [Candidatus Sericytochromatia bacterium]|nr:effector binding domain-containing protein [Candidatus Sericytochromatia bacterium]